MNALHYYYGNKVVKTKYDENNIEEIINKNFSLFEKNKSTLPTYQAFHNLYARKLNIPSLQVTISDDIENVTVFYHTFTNKNEENVGIQIDNYAEYTDGILELFCYMIHETKHAHQCYLLHEFLNNKIMPESNYNKLLVLSKLFCLKETQTAKLKYYSRIDELDAYVYELEEYIKLSKNFKNFNENELKTYQINNYNKILLNLKPYNNKNITRLIQTIQNDIDNSLQGKYGELFKTMVRQFDNVNIENAINNLIQRLINLNKFLYLEQEKTP